MSAFAVKTATQIYTNSRTVDSWSSLVSKYLEYREQHGPIVPPTISYEDACARIQSGDFSFLAEPSTWQFRLDGGNYYIDETSKLAELKAPLHILILEDIRRSEIIVLSSTDGKRYKGEALFSAPKFADTSYMSKLNLTPEELVEEQKFYAFEELAPRRVVWHVLLKPAKDALSDLVSSRDRLAVQSLSSPESDGMTRSMSVPAEHTNDLWMGIEGTNLSVFAPQDFSNRVEIFQTDNLVSNAWTTAVQGLLPVSTNPATWAVSPLETCGFFRCGNMDIDSDSDGLPDARESIVHKTLPNNPDTDDDYMPDGWELQYGFNPLLYSDGGFDSDSDGLSNADEYLNETDPTDPDSEDDGMPDGYEVANVLDPLFNDATNDPDADGLTNGDEAGLGSSAIDPDSDNDGLPDGVDAHPLDADSDNDGLEDGYEVENSETDPTDPDTDDDGMSDGYEVANGLDPLINDASDDWDGDDLTNGAEAGLGSSANDSDSDDDGLPDGDEVENSGTDPTDPDSEDDGMPDGWEVENGLDPLSNDATNDPDQDGLTNRAEFQAGADPTQANTVVKWPLSNTGDKQAGDELAFEAKQSTLYEEQGGFPGFVNPTNRYLKGEQYYVTTNGNDRFRTKITLPRDLFRLPLRYYWYDYHDYGCSDKVYNKVFFYASEIGLDEQSYLHVECPYDYTNSCWNYSSTHLTFTNSGAIGVQSCFGIGSYQTTNSDTSASNDDNDWIEVSQLYTKSNFIGDCESHFEEYALDRIDNIGWNMYTNLDILPSVPGWPEWTIDKDGGTTDWDKYDMYQDEDYLGVTASRDYDANTLDLTAMEYHVGIFRYDWLPPQTNSDVVYRIDTIAIMEPEDTNTPSWVVTNFSDYAMGPACGTTNWGQPHTIQPPDEDGQIYLDIFKVEFDNVWDRNLDPLATGNFPDYEKCIAIEHDSSGELDLEAEDYLKIEPAGLTWDDIKDAVDLEIETPIFGSATIDGSVLDYADWDPGDTDIYAFAVRLLCGGAVVDRLIVVIYDSDTEDKYNDTGEWVASNPVNPAWLAELPAVHSCLAAENSDPEPGDPNLWGDVDPININNNYHYAAAFNMRSVETAGRHGHQACYDGDGDLIEDDGTGDQAEERLASCGTADFVHRDNWMEQPTHFRADVAPFIRAAQLDGNPVDGTFGLNNPLIRVGPNLQSYYDRRPPHTGNQVP